MIVTRIAVGFYSRDVAAPAPLSASSSTSHRARVRPRTGEWVKYASRNPPKRTAKGAGYQLSPTFGAVADAYPVRTTAQGWTLATRSSPVTDIGRSLPFEGCGCQFPDASLHANGVSGLVAGPSARFPNTAYQVRLLRQCSPRSLSRATLT
jgi:hypothetical protein